MAASGEVLEQLAEEQLNEIVAALKQARVEAVAVSLRIFFANPTHEQAVAAALASLAVPLSISYQILRVSRVRAHFNDNDQCLFTQPLMEVTLNRLQQAATCLMRPAASKKQRPKTKDQSSAFASV